MIKLISSSIWETISKLSRKSKRTKVAVAYFGTDATKQLKLKKGDTLIVAMGLNNVKSGQVNPFEVEKLLNMGVKLFNLPNLHSKIYLFDDKVIVGSANVSTNSAETLIESGILTNDKSTVGAANKFISRHCIEKIENDYIEVCKKNYSSPKFFGQVKVRNSNKLKFQGKLSRLWVISTTPTAWKESDYEATDNDRQRFEKKILNKRTFEVSEIKYNSSNSFINAVKEGDILIEIETHKVKASAIQPKRALGVTWDRANKKAFLRTEERKRRKLKGWTHLQKELLRNGIRGITKNSTREIRNENTKRVLLDFFNN